MLSFLFLLYAVFLAHAYSVFLPLEKCTNHNNRKHSDEEMPSQVDTVEYLGPSRYNMVPQSTPEKYKPMHYRSAEASTASFPPQVGLENQSPWGGSMNSSGMVATPLLSGSPYSPVSGMPGMRQPMTDSRHSISPDQPMRPAGGPANTDGLWIRRS